MESQKMVRARGCRVGIRRENLQKFVAIANREAPTGSGHFEKQPARGNNRHNGRRAQRPDSLSRDHQRGSNAQARQGCAPWGTGLTARIACWAPPQNADRKTRVGREVSREHPSTAHGGSNAALRGSVPANPHPVRQPEYGRSFGKKPLPDAFTQRHRGISISRALALSD